MKRIVLAAIVYGSIAGTAMAAGNLSSSDKKFLEHDAQGGMYEMQLSQMAEQNSSDPKIKQFAEQNVKDHTALAEQAAQIAHENGMTLPTMLPPAKQKELDHLRTLNGAAFDKAFVKAMKSINKDDKSGDKEELAATKDDQMKQYLQQGRDADAKHAAIVKTL